MLSQFLNLLYLYPVTKRAWPVNPKNRWKADCAMRKLLHYFTPLLILCWSGFRVVGQPILVSNPSACGLNIVLSDNTCPEANPNIYMPDEIGIQVNGVSGTVLGVDVYLKEVRIMLAHAWMSDVGISLTSPGGRTVLLTADNGGSADNMGNPADLFCTEYAVLSIAACVPISQGTPPYTDRPYRPEESLLHFNDNNTNPNALWIMRFCDDVPNDIGILQYVELVFEPLSCLPVEAVQVLRIDTTTVRLDWSPAGNCNNVLIEYGPPGFQPGTGDGFIETVQQCPPFNLMDLAPDTEYDIYIRRLCPDTGSSSNSCPIRVRTGCQPPPTTLVENFNALTPCLPNCAAVCNISGVWRNVGGDDFDWLVYQGPTPTPNTGPLADVTGNGRYAYIETSGSLCNNGRLAYLESNCIRLRKFDSDTCNLSFNYHMFGANVNTLRLQVSQDGGFFWTTLWQRTGNQGNAWQKAYIGLGNFPEGAVLKFRFAGIGGNGSLGDIAIDNIVFHGSEDLGAGGFIYYVDNDLDGYGRSNLTIQSCSPNPPSGYAVQGGDCNDNNPNVNPGMQEIPCNNIDDNCNGMDDDNDLPSPLATGAIVCSGEPVQICAQSAYGGFLLWYGSPDGIDFVDFGACISPALPPNNSPIPVTHYFYVEEFAPPCLSVVRTEVAVVVNPVPEAAAVAPVSICAGAALNLAEIAITDNNFTGGTISFHSESPAGPANVLPSVVVSPAMPRSYYFLITSPGGCTDEGQIDVTLQPQLNLSFMPSDSFFLCKDATQAVAVLPSGGAGAYGYFWSTGSTSPSITVAAGTPGNSDVYYVTVTNTAACAASDSVIVRTINSIDSLQRSITHVSTCGGSDGQIFLNPLNGQSPFNYVWTSNNGVSGSATGIAGAYTISGLPQGAYRVTITDNSNPPCAFILRQILVNGPNASIGAPVVTPVSCHGGSDGNICLTVNGVNPQYLWSTGGTGNCVNGLPAGNYSVTITSGICQTVLSDIEAPEPDSLRIFGNVIPPDCSGSSNGAIQINVFGGTPGYQYVWSNGAVTKDIQGLSAGSYTLSLTDARGCTLTDTFELIAPAPLQINIDSLSHPTCFGSSNGYVRVSGTGGTGPYQYQWPGGGASPVLFQAAAGAYQVAVTDINGCQALRVIVLSQPMPLSLTTIEINRPNCLGNNDGSISVAGNGGTGPYQFAWNNGPNGSAIQNLAPGVYSVSLADANNCDGGSLSFVLDPLSVLQLQIDVQMPSCVGRTNGSIALQPSGTLPFSFLWADDSSQNPERTNIGIGEYAVQITDGQGCIYDTIVPLTAPQLFNVQMNILSPACHNGPDGLIDLTLTQSSGQTPYVFLWSNGADSEDLVGVPAGDYTVVITDALGCRYESATVMVPNPEPLVMEVIGAGPVLCHDDSNGFIEVEISGGTPPYSNPSLYGIPAGTYMLQATDSLSCPVNLTVVLPAPPPLIVNVTVTQSGDCQALVVTRLDAFASGGVPPYSFLWSSGDTTAVIINAAPGDYALTVKDANGCEFVITGIKVREQIAPLAIAAFTPTNVTCFGAQNGKLTVKLAGGSGLYRYHFSTNQITTTGADSIQVGGLNTGSNYRVTVTDLNTGCVVTAGPVTITQPQPLAFFRTSIVNVSCFGINNGAVYAVTSGGTPPYQYQWFNADGDLAGNNEDLEQVGPSIYTGVVTDSNGCITILANQPILNLNDSISLVDTLLNISNFLCSGDSSGFISIVVTGGVLPYQYNWSNGATGASVTGLPTGEYLVTVTDNAMCQKVFGPFSITAAPTLSVGINAVPPDGTGSNGAVNAIVSGGTQPYTYFWSTGDTTPSVQPLGPGAYFLTVTDAAGCTATASAVLVRSREVEYSPAVRVFPNPGAGQFQVEYDSPSLRIETIRIRSMEGKMVHFKRLSGARSGQELLLLDTLPSGVYIIELYGEGVVAYRQLLLLAR